MITKLIKIKYSLLEYVNKILFILATLNNIFEKIVKNPSNFVIYLSSSFHFLHCHALLLWLHIYNKYYSYLNVANKMQNVVKSIFFTPCF